MNEKERVKVWNSFFRPSRTYAEALYRSMNGKDPKPFNWGPAGETLDEKSANALAMLAFCCLAIEARVNHMTDEMVKDKRLDPKAGRKLLKNKNFRQRWFGLAAQVGAPLDKTKEPHKTIWKLFDIRDAIFHAKFDDLIAQLAKLTHYKFFTEFVYAMDDYNAKLRRVPTNPEVRRIGEFE